MLNTFNSKIIKKEALTEDVFKFTFSCPKEFEFKAGQFISIKVEQEDESKRRSYSILNSPNKKDVLELCIKIVQDGFASNIFNNSKIGESYEIKGPFGHFSFDKETDFEHWFIATGTGVTPFYSMLQENLDTKKRITLLFGAKTKKELLFHDEFERLEQTTSNFKYIPTLTREAWNGKTGRVQAHLPKDLSNKIFYLCGLKNLVIETEALLLERGVQKENIRKERYS